MKRVIQQEFLDHLPPDDPGAMASRQDLRRLNAWMGNAAIAARALRRVLPDNSPRRIVDIGAGDGAFLLQVARILSPGRARGQRAPAAGSGDALLVDRQDLLGTETQRAFAECNWTVRMLRADVFHFLENDAAAVDVVIANLFLHHFAADRLQALFQSTLKKSRVLIAIEPRRSRWALFFSRLVWMIGCNAVTRHDAVASVRAGFKGRELSSLWPDRNRWQVLERPAGIFSHLFVACRKN